MKNNIEIRAKRSNWLQGVDLLIRIGNKCANPITFEKNGQDNIYREPSIKIDNTKAQTLMDDLWYAGFRPTEGTGSAGSLMATEKHLEDMRKIVSKKLNVIL